MSEPTPLSDCETQVYYGYSCGIVAEQAATIDAQATEIAALKGALEELAKKVGDYVVAKERMAGRADYETYMLMQLNRMADAAIEALVLAGKEAQGG